MNEGVDRIIMCYLALLAGVAIGYAMCARQECDTLRTALDAVSARALRAERASKESPAQD